MTTQNMNNKANYKKKILLGRYRKYRHLAYSNTWQTTLVVAFIVFISVGLTIWLFWRSLYLPELKNHARYLATELIILDDISENDYGTHEERLRLRSKMHTVFISNPNEFPKVQNKIFAGYFTDIMQKELSNKLGRPITIYFKFKPTSELWVHDSKHPEYWIREPVIYYSQYNTSIIVAFLLGIPILTILTILLLARQLNRPLRNLQRAANNYNQLGHATTLPTRQGSTEIRQVNTAFNRLFTTLNQAQKERTIMLAGISHDLRTPLTRMRLTAEMLPDEFLREGLIYDVEDMDAILEQFISFMKDGSDEAVSLTDLDSIFHEIIIQFAPLPFNHEENKKLQAVPLRPLSIKRLIVNLVNNASRYGKPPIQLSASVVPTLNEFQDDSYDLHEYELDDVTEKISTTPSINMSVNMPLSALANEASEELVISVRDYGDGVADSELERIMQPFERGESARTTNGSGLGLAIVSRIAHLHHGRVEARNHPEGGLEVCVIIPLLSDIISEHGLKQGLE